MPLNTVQSEPNKTFDLLFDLAINQELGFVNYFLGGAASEVPVSALRGAIWNVFPNGEAAGQKVRDFVPEDLYGACFNHHSPTEVNWRKSLWGLDTYNDLLSIKEKYDPNHVFNCWHCVGYLGDENPRIDGEPAFENSCPVENNNSGQGNKDGGGSSAECSMMVGSLSGLYLIFLSAILTIG